MNQNGQPPRTNKLKDLQTDILHTYMNLIWLNKVDEQFTIEIFGFPFPLGFGSFE